MSIFNQLITERKEDMKEKDRKADEKEPQEK